MVDEKKCLEIYNKCHTQVAQFLSDYLPELFDVTEIISPLDTASHKVEEAKAVIGYFWKNTVTPEFTIKEIEKEHKSQKYRVTRKIFMTLKNCAGCVMGKNEQIYECLWDENLQKFVPKTGECEHHDQFKWCIPKSLTEEDYVIASEIGTDKRSPIWKLDLKTLQPIHLYTKRKYV